jgi:hypothetical protein
VFLSSPEYYASNINQARITNAAAATLTAPGGERQPAVVLYKKGKIYGVLPAAEALRLANEIADAIEQSEQANA